MGGIIRACSGSVVSQSQPWTNRDGLGRHMCDVQERMEAERAALATAHGSLMAHADARKFQTYCI